MQAEMTLTLAFLAGLAGAGHCWAMCGGLAGGLFLAGASSPLAYSQWAYHGGRVLAYALIGALAAGLGQAVVLTGGVGRAQGVLYLVAGILVVLAGWRAAGLPPWRQRAGWCADRPARAALAHPMPAKDLPRQAWPLAGFVNGLMPCSLVFSLALKAATAPSVATGAAWLLAFGLGTVPAMALAAGLAQALGRQSLVWLRRLAGLLLVVLGAQTIWAGARFFHVMLHL
ncbi:MAG: sulfite exporter TauE/SafE family protein [Thiobacillaceae bacterium]|jgi:hypothetical protein|nr:sulfite exporter TauE/SafE family protein [Thiobacillaceae bacterium]